MPKSRSKGYFPKVKEARQVLADKAVEILETYVATIKAAQAAGDYEVAAQSLQWLMEHMPEDPEGTTLVDVSVDKVKAAELGGGPNIMIGFKIGGLPEAKALPEPIIEVVAVTPKAEDDE